MTEKEEGSGRHQATGARAFPRMFHIGVPVVAALILIIFAVTVSLPANKGALPVQSTLYFIPMYVAVVIFLVFASMYVFKTFVEKDVSTATH